MLPAPSDGSAQLADVWVNGRKLRTKVAAEVDLSQLRRGSEVLLNESMVLLEVLDPTDTGEVQSVKHVLPDGRAIMVGGRSDMETAVRLAGELDPETVEAGGDLLTVDLKLGLAYAKVPKVDVEELVLAEIPRCDLGRYRRPGRPDRADHRRDRTPVPAPRPVRRLPAAGPARGGAAVRAPRVGKTMIAKAVANSLAQQIARDEGAGPPQAGAQLFLQHQGPPNC